MSASLKGSRRSVAFATMVAVTALSMLVVAAVVRVVPARAAGWVVNTLGDPASGTCAGGSGSLRQCIAAANAASGAQSITFGVAGTITLTGGVLPITGSDITITGPGARTLFVDGGGTTSILNVHIGGGLHLSDITIQHGSGGLASGIDNEGTVVTLDRVGLIGNQATDTAAIYNRSGNVTMSDTLVQGNTSASVGAFESDGGVVDITNTTFTGNVATGAWGTLWTDATMHLLNVTISGNTGKTTGEIYNGGGSVSLKNTIIANNALPSCSGTFIDGGYNIDSGTSCGFTAGSPKFDKPSTDPLLNAVANNGGPTDTMSLKANSPALDAGSADCPPPAIDQRGVTRPRGPACDIGAVEMAVAAAPTVTSVSPNTGQPGASVTVTGTGFTGATQVRFGTAAATTFTVVSDTSIHAVVPAGSGTVDVTVTNPVATSPANAGDRFTYTVLVASPSPTPSLTPALPKAGSPRGPSALPAVVAVLFVLVGPLVVGLAARRA